MKSKYMAQQEALEKAIQTVWDELNGRSVPKKKPITPPKPDHTTFMTDIRGPRPPIVRSRKSSSTSQKQSSDQVSQEPGYDRGIVVHVDNIQPRTNKSILKVRFHLWHSAIV